jgi:hypothetical protein
LTTAGAFRRAAQAEEVARSLGIDPADLYM